MHRHSDSSPGEVQYAIVSGRKLRYGIHLSSRKQDNHATCSPAMKIIVTTTQGNSPHHDLFSSDWQMPLATHSTCVSNVRVTEHFSRSEIQSMKASNIHNFQEQTFALQIGVNVSLSGTPVYLVCSQDDPDRDTMLRSKQCGNFVVIHSWGKFLTLSQSKAPLMSVNQISPYIWQFQIQSYLCFPHVSWQECLRMRKRKTRPNICQPDKNEEGRG